MTSETIAISSSWLNIDNFLIQYFRFLPNIYRLLHLELVLLFQDSNSVMEPIFVGNIISSFFNEQFAGVVLLNKPSLLFLCIQNLHMTRKQVNLSGKSIYYR
jgi:hypothetical protein